MSCADSSTVECLLFQAGDGGSTPTPALHWRIIPVSHKTAKGWVEKWHYSRRIPTGKNYLFGLFCDEELYAVAVYGIGVNPFQARYLKAENVMELKRLARAEPRRDYPMSRFVALTTRMLRKEVGFDCLVSFSDPEEGHEGTLYRACGFQLHGETNAEWHLIDSQGIKRHRRFAYRHARRAGITMAEARKALGLARVKTKPKRRWVKYFSK